MLLNLMAQAAARPALEGGAHPGTFVFLVLLMVGIVALVWKLREPGQGSAATARPSSPPASPAAPQSDVSVRCDSSATPPVEHEPRGDRCSVDGLHGQPVDRPAPSLHARDGRPAVRRPRNDSPTVC